MVCKDFGSLIFIVSQEGTATTQGSQTTNFTFTFILYKGNLYPSPFTSLEQESEMSLGDFDQLTGYMGSFRVAFAVHSFDSHVENHTGLTFHRLLHIAGSLIAVLTPWSTVFCLDSSRSRSSPLSEILGLCLKPCKNVDASRPLVLVLSSTLLNLHISTAHFRASNSSHIPEVGV